MPAKNRTSEVTSSSLLERARQHDQVAWERLVKIYSPLVFHWCRTDAGLNSEDAADVMQEVFRAVAASLGSFRKTETGTFRGWLRIITANKIRDLLRKLRSRAEGVGGTDWNQQLRELPESASDDTDVAEESLVMRQVLELLAKRFQERSRQAFWLMAMEGYTAAESAAQLGMSEQAVWQACYRIRRWLREELNELID